jgi:hypothetical protein
MPGQKTKHKNRCRTEIRTVFSPVKIILSKSYRRALTLNILQSLSAAIVQLFSSEPPHHTSWVHREFGVLCLVKDNFRRSYFFRLYCLTRNILVWEHEVYNHIDYRSPRPFLHTFEAEVKTYLHLHGDFKGANVEC